MKKTYVVPMTLLAGFVLLADGCQKKEEKSEAPKTAGKSAMLPTDSSNMPPGQMAPGKGKPFPKEMLEAMAKVEQRPPGSASMQGMPSKPMGQMAPTGPKKHAPVTIPQNVKGKWKAVIITVSNKQTKGTKDYTVDLEKDFVIPDTKLRIKVLSFLPNFTMSPQGITSVSNDPVNPAAQVVVYEDGRDIFEGWLFEKHPSVHSFQHKSYGIILKGQKPA